LRTACVALGRPPQRTVQYVCGGRPAKRVPPARGYPLAGRALRSALSSLRDENLCIIRAKSIQSMCIHCSRQKMGADVNDANATGFQLSIYFISVLKISGTKGWFELSPPGHIDVFGRPDQKIDSPL